MIGNTSSRASIFALVLKVSLYLRLSILTSPAVTIKIARSLILKDNVLAIRSGAQFKALAASSTVALETSNSIISCSRLNCFK